VGWLLHRATLSHSYLAQKVFKQLGSNPHHSTGDGRTIADNRTLTGSTKSFGSLFQSSRTFAARCYHPRPLRATSLSPSLFNRQQVFAPIHNSFETNGTMRLGDITPSVRWTSLVGSLATPYHLRATHVWLEAVILSEGACCL